MFGKKPFDPKGHQEDASSHGANEEQSNLPVAAESTLVDHPAQSALQKDRDRFVAKLTSDLQQLHGGDETIKAQYRDLTLETAEFKEGKQQVLEQLIQQVDFIALSKLDTGKQRERLQEIMDRMIQNIHLPLNEKQILLLKQHILDELFGFGPLEPLLEDPDISDIMVNSFEKVYIEKSGKLMLTDVAFYDEQHLLSVIQRIVARVGRRVDESSPMVDARMPDGSRFNAIIPPLAIDGSLVSIRRFKKNKMPLEAYVDYDSMSPQMAKFLGICSFIGLNMIISGGTGSGKTTLLNALSGAINFKERIITIEDAAELQLQQPHVLRLESRPASMEGKGEISQRQLVKNALRMRPDRIILGEIRGDEVIDVLSAMNTGHDGSMATIHSNSPRDCLSRLENLVNMSNVAIPITSLRKQIASAIQIVVQIERQRDGKRRVTAIEEIVEVQGEVISMQTLFHYHQTGIDADGNLLGEFVCNGIRPKIANRAGFYGLKEEVLECISVSR